MSVQLSKNDAGPNSVSNITRIIDCHKKCRALVWFLKASELSNAEQTAASSLLSGRRETCRCLEFAEPQSKISEDSPALFSIFHLKQKQTKNPEVTALKSGR